jgi:hypothetical protein
MKRISQSSTLIVLQWTVALVVILEAAIFALSGATYRQLVHMGLPAWIAPSLGGAEILAGLIFLMPRTNRVGAYALLVVFALAVLIHFAHGQFNVGPIFVYAAAVLACTGQANRSPEPRA